MGRLSTHVLDTANGKPAGGMRIDLSALLNDGWIVLKSVLTNADGRTEEPLLAGEALAAGVYRLEFHVADYFRAVGAQLSDPPFLDRVPLQFAVADPLGHYHIPLLCSPWSYSTYRGS